MAKRFFTSGGLLFFLLVSYSLSAEENAHSFMATSSIFARSIAMGGAFTAMSGGLENALYNPAGLGMESAFVHTFGMAFNPIGATSALLNRDELTVRPVKDVNDWLSAVGLFMRAISFGKTGAQISLLLSEELPGNPGKVGEKHAVSARGMLDWNFHTAALRVTPAKQVSLGATGYLFNCLAEDERMVKSFGASYGILMKPSEQVSAGLSYFNFPEGTDSLMLQQFRISNKSINVGILYQPARFIKLAFDFRNVSEEDNNSTNEMHAGLEFTPLRFLALRAGYYRQNLEQVDVFAAGFGLADFRVYRGETDHFVFSNIILNYGLQIDKLKSSLDMQHFVTFLLRF